MKRWIWAAALGATLIASSAWARKGGAHKADKGDQADDPDDDDATTKPDPNQHAEKAGAKKSAKKVVAAKKKPADDDDSDDDDDDAAPTKGGAKGTKGAPKGGAKADAASKKSGGDDDSGDDDDDDSSGGFKGSTSNVTKDTGATPMVKQDLNGHDMGARKLTTASEKDRFFVDKSDTAKTAKGTLIQGSLTSSSFVFHESGGALAGMAGNEASGDNRMFTDLRLQTDFRHLGGGRWDARIDGRIRFVNSGTSVDETATGTAGPTTNIQSGLFGTNEYDLRELWLIRNGERTDVTIGRQFITDLAAVKIDGLRVDYASSSQLTYLGFAGLSPFRGSRSITTDYIDLKNPSDGTPAGKFIGTGGFGAAYRTPSAYGAFGGVAQVPLEAEQPRVFGTANGYWRLNPKLDIYHYALIDLVSSYGAQLTNLTGGINYKPTQRLRMTASYNRVDTETLNIQAGAYLDTQGTNSTVNNETFVARLATNEARGSISAGLGELERFEVTVAAAYRSRPEFTLIPFVAPGGTAAPSITLSAARGYELYGSLIDRHSFADTRIGIDAVKTFAAGTISFQRDEVFALRGFVSRELPSGKGEWEAEVSYSTTKDTNSGYTCPPGAALTECFGQTNGSVLSAGGALYYRLDRDWFVIGQAYVSQTELTTMGATAADPSILGLSGYFRIAYRF
ncbi:MAG: hypothetical protein ABI467_11220 [Kofleriaceae bacterium]